MLTERQEQLIDRGLNNVWQYIGGDCLVDENGNYDESVTLSQDEVIELCLDADRLKLHGKPYNVRTEEQKKEWDDAVEEFYKLSYDEMITFCKEKVFTYKTYGA